MCDHDQRKIEAVIKIIGLISITIGAAMIAAHMFDDDVLLKESRAAMIGHCALMVGGIVMLVKLPMRPHVDVGEEFADMERNYRAIVTAIVSVGMCFMLWGLINMAMYGFTAKRMLCFLLGLLPLLSIMICNSRTIEYISLMWKMSMSLAIGLMLIPIVTDLSNIQSALASILTITGCLLCIWLVYCNEPYMPAYLKAREDGIMRSGSPFRSERFYIIVTLIVTMMGTVYLLDLSLDHTMTMIYVPEALFGLDPYRLMELLLVLGCFTGEAIGWYSSFNYLRPYCFDCSKYTFTIMISNISAMIGLISVFSMATYGRNFEFIILGMIIAAMMGLTVAIKTMKSRRSE